jgi:hypothetical protein
LVVGAASDAHELAPPEMADQQLACQTHDAVPTRTFMSLWKWRLASAFASAHPRKTARERLWRTLLTVNNLAPYADAPTQQLVKMRVAQGCPDR